MFSQTTEYALRAMTALAMTPDRLVPTSTLAAQTKVPPNYLAKVLQQLAAAGLITGRRGVGGGYKLSSAATDIRLLDVVSAIGEIPRIECAMADAAGSAGSQCSLHRKTAAAVKAATAVFGNTTFQDLLNDSLSTPALCTAAASATPNLALAKA